MEKILVDSGYLGVILTLFSYLIGIKLNRRFKYTILNPILIGSALIIAILMMLGINYSVYKESTENLSILLTPATICLAVPMYKQFEILKKYKGAVFISVMVGSICALLTIILMAGLLGFDLTTIKSLMPKSITTAIAIGVSEEIGGIPTITIMAVVLTGILGAIITEKVCKIFRIKNPVAVGLAHGTSAHAIGTSKALEIGELEGAMSSIAIIMAGLITVFIIPIIMNFL